MRDALTARATAQAKVNLGLRILSRAPSGFHTLETLFHQLELADDVTVRRTPAERILIVTGPALPPQGLGPGRDNLAWRAAAAYAAEAGWEGGFEIELVKRIPAGGGLGGGSSDAGAVLRACEWLSPEPLGPHRLAEIATMLGSDVPFLAGGGAAAIGRGRGELLEPVAPLPAADVALVFPPFSVATKEAYRWLATSRGDYPASDQVIDSGQVTDWGTIVRQAENDFEPVVAERHPEIGVILDTMRRAGAMLAMLSGSGSTVFGIFERRAAAAARDTPGLREMMPAGVSVVWTRTAECVVPVARAG